MLQHQHTQLSMCHEAKAEASLLPTIVQTTNPCTCIWTPLQVHPVQPDSVTCMHHMMLAAEEGRRVDSMKC